jgi:plastocyanin
MKKIILTALCLVFAGSITAEEAEDARDNGGTISGTIEVRRLRNAKDVLVYLENVEGKFEPSQENPVIDQKDLTFIPHVLPVLAGTTVLFTNNDKVKHNVFSPSKCCKFNLGTYDAGVVREVTFDTPGVTNVLCNVHTEMSAFIIILQNPYFAITDPDGKFSIKSIPPGTYKIKTWHEKLREKEQDVTVVEGEIITIDFKLSR